MWPSTSTQWNSTSPQVPIKNACNLAAYYLSLIPSVCLFICLPLSVYLYIFLSFHEQAQNYAWKIPKTPVKKTVAPTSNIMTNFRALQQGPIGFALNGKKNNSIRQTGLMKFIFPWQLKMRIVVRCLWYIVIISSIFELLKSAARQIHAYRHY